jgi:FdhE protein
VAAGLEALHRRRPLTGRLADDHTALADGARDLFRYAAESGPAALAGAARARGAEDDAVFGSRLLVFWAGDETTEPDDYLSRALLRPYMEALAQLGITSDHARLPGLCPACGGPPWIAVRRSPAQGDGASRFLGCSLCGREWPLGRILCPSCSEEDPERLPFFQSESYPAARIETCETCRRYVKSIDLDVDARAIPEVDDLVSLGMDLWAAGEGFTRIEPGLAGL